MDLSMGVSDIRGSWLRNFWESYLVPERGPDRDLSMDVVMGG